MKKLYTCQRCNIDVFETYGTSRFCSIQCARAFSTATDKNKTKSMPCVGCGIPTIVAKRTSPTKCKCDNCKKLKKLNEYQCKRCTAKILSTTKKTLCTDWRCKTMILPTLVDYFGFNSIYIGTKNYHREFEKIRVILTEFYIEREFSSIQLADRFNHPNIGSIVGILRSIKIPTRNASNALSVSIKNGISTPPTSFKYKSGWHTTWTNEQVFYRSSYELSFAQTLDDNKTQYYMEHLRIMYWDTILQKYRVAIPDFYIPSTNTIIEIKSNYSLDIQNMKDKLVAYNEHGYNFKLFVEHELVDLMEI